MCWGTQVTILHCGNWLKYTRITTSQLTGTWHHCAQENTMAWMLTNGITWTLLDLSTHIQNDLAALSTDIVVAAG